MDRGSLVALFLVSLAGCDSAGVISGTLRTQATVPGPGAAAGEQEADQREPAPGGRVVADPGGAGSDASEPSAYGPEPADAASEEATDAASEEADASEAAVDAGAEVADAGSPDRGVAATDAGRAPVDAGRVRDSGVVDSGAPDSGAAPADAGAPPRDGAPGFRFISWGDTKSDRAPLADLSRLAVTLQPVFTIYAGDLEDNGFTTTGMNLWKDAINGGAGTNNGVFDITFPVRGNHDDNSTSGWQSYFALRSTAAAIGASNYTVKDEDLTYSFDYGNAHFAGLDAPGGNSLVTDELLTWLDQDLAAAARRGLTHAFLFWHGPIYPVANHCCSVNTDITQLINRHPIVTATFHGHEHTYAYVHIDSSRISNVTHEFEQFVTGAAGAGPSSCQSGRTDACMSADGLATVDVEGRDVTVTWYRRGQQDPERTFSFTKP